MTVETAIAENVEHVTWDEVCRRYPDEWIMLVDIDWVNETDFDFRSAIAVAHGPHRKDVFARARPVLDGYAGFGCYFTGRIRAPLRGFFAP